MTNTTYLSESVEAARTASAEAYYEERTLRPAEHFSITPGHQEYDVVCLHGRLPVVPPYTKEAHKFFDWKSKVVGIEGDDLIGEKNDRYKITAHGGLSEKELADILFEMLL
ncbi:MAG: hypothetical protein H6577_26910 [Lewinellaceae bacterium]|nr:hypothetical protein [Saprospiraceae bacterium]MCB9341773.1 hypothetical protein [Lewinellaceae bacterium]